MPPLPSHIGAFEVIRQLGSGGMGTVYLGRDAALNRKVAIKMLRDQVQDEELLARFLREAQSAANLRHPNIITIHATGHHEYQPYIVMEYVEGASLADIIRQRRPVTLADKLSWLEQICAGLHFAHRAGVIHRDVKPANIMVDGEGVVRILDFGIARTIGSGMTRDGVLIGTVNYMSPEQMLGRPVDHRSDIFAVGLVAYELLCYRQAFEGGLTDGLLHRLPHEDPTPLPELYPDLPPAVDRVVMRALQKAPEHRFADLAEMRAALGDAREHLDTEVGQTVVVRTAAAHAPAPSHRERQELSVRRFLVEASAHLEKGETAAALMRLRDAVAIDPANAAAREMLARVQQSAVSPGVQPGTGPGSAPAAAPRSAAWAWAAGIAAALALMLAAVPWFLARETPTDTAPAVTNAPVAGVDAPAAPASPPVSAAPAPAPPEATPAVPAAPPAAAPRGSAAPPPPRPAPSTVTPPPAVDPALADSGLQDLLARVRTMYASGDLPGALDLLARSAAAGDPRVGDVAARVAAAAFDAMSSSEKSATARNAQEFAGDTWRIALDAKGRAEAARQRAAHVDAGLQALLARDAFQQAAIDALARRTQPAAAPPAAATAAAPAPAPAAPPPAAAPAPPNPLDRERPGLIAALGRFQAAYRDRDINAVVQVYPSLQREARQALQRAFDTCRAYDVQFDDMRFLVDPADPTTAQVNVRSTYTCTPRTGQRPVSAPQQDVFTLRKRADLWVIEKTGRVD